MTGSPDADVGSRPAEHRHNFEFLPEVRDEANRLDDQLRRAIAEIVVALHSNPWMGELMDERWPENLEGCRKIRFDAPSWKRKPRYRFVYRNEPTDGAVATIVVLAIERRSDMIAYARASSRLARREAAKRRPGRGKQGRA